MRWEELTGDRFAEAVEECQGVCLVPLSVIERHGHHLPLGTDMFEARGMLSRVAALEPVIEFPDFYFTQIAEARHLAGTISIDGDLMVKLLDNVCREIARNGLKKIVLVNAHGGNNGFVALFNMLQLLTLKEYVVYLVDTFGFLSRENLPWDDADDNHAGPTETSMMLALRPDLVHMDRVPADDEGKARDRLRALIEAGVRPGIWWYADYPTHYPETQPMARRKPGSGCWIEWPRASPAPCAPSSPTRRRSACRTNSSPPPLRPSSGPPLRIIRRRVRRTRRGEPGDSKKQQAAPARQEDTKQKSARFRSKFS